MKPNVNDVWDLISQLTPQERKVIYPMTTRSNTAIFFKNSVYKRLNEDIKFKLNDILDNVSSGEEVLLNRINGIEENPSSTISWREVRRE